MAPSLTAPRQWRRPSLLLLPLLGLAAPALLLTLGATTITPCSAFVPLPAAPTTARPAAAAAATTRAAPLSVRWASEGPGGAGGEEGQQELPEGFPTDRPLTSVEKRRIERATKTDSARKLSKNQRMLDDFIGKRMGTGTAFYGKSLSDMTDEEYESMVEDQGKNVKDERLEIRPLRENPVLVVGATGGTGQWVVSDLLSKGFSVRAFVRRLEKAEDLFGWDGSNLDVFEGDVKDYEALREATQGALAVIYCAGSRDILGGNSFEQVDGVGVENAVRAAQESGREPGAPPSVRKFILLSSIGVSRPDEYGFFGKLLGDPLRAKARGERAVRRSGLESYCIVRAAGLRDGDGVKRRVELGQGDQWGRCGVSRLDVANLVVQALVQDVNNVTFEVRNGEEVVDAAPMEAILGTADQRQIVEYFLREDAREEEFWAERLAALVPDDPAAP